MQYVAIIVTNNHNCTTCPWCLKTQYEEIDNYIIDQIECKIGEK